MSKFVDNETYLADVEEQEEPVSTEGADASAPTQIKPRELFVFWEVGGTQYKLKLRPSAITSLEHKFRCNLLNLMGNMDDMPTLTTMLQITHAAMEEWHHGLKFKRVEELYGKWIDEGGSMLQFYVEVFMKIYSVSGFFSNTMAAELSETMDEAAQKM